ncbi:MAG TPA: SGNH/GDSL hydrolase family protein [Gemmatimonadaceae bacterium]|nr:SGNH/GDSL hydrolase family protein [Gemmatimonadaceae bacterium]
MAINAALNSSGELREGGLLIESILSSESYQKATALDGFIARRAGAPMGVVLGSSRVMELSFGDSTSPVPFYNCGVSGAKAEDILAFTRYIFAHPDVDLAEAMIGVDPFALAVPIPGNTTEYYDVRLRGVYALERVMQDRIDPRERLKWRAAALLGRDWTTALREVGDPAPHKWFGPTGLYPESNYVKRVGTSAEARERYLANHIEMVVTHLPVTADPDPRRVQDITEAVRLLREHGTKVTIFLPPTHPRLLAALRSNAIFRAQLDHDRAALRELAGSAGATFVDLTDAATAGLTPGDFWDGYHYTSAASALVIRALEDAR